MTVWREAPNLPSKQQLGKLDSCGRRGKAVTRSFIYCRVPAQRSCNFPIFNAMCGHLRSPNKVKKAHCEGADLRRSMLRPYILSTNIFRSALVPRMKSGGRHAPRRDC